MTHQEVYDDLKIHARRLVDAGIINAGSVTINPDAGTVSNKWTGEVLHYESGVTVAWHPWRQQYWESA